MSDESLVIQCPVCDGRKSHAHCVGDLLATPDAGAREAEIARVISSEIGDAIAAHEAGEGEAAVSKRGETVARWIMDRTHPTPPRAASPELEAVDALVRTIATEAYKHWVADRDSKVGKLLAALAGTTGIRLDLDGVCAAAPRADATAGGVTEVLIAALRDIATNYDHDEQTREHTPGYGGACRVCTAEAALRAAQPDGGAK